MELQTMKLSDIRSEEPIRRALERCGYIIPADSVFVNDKYLVTRSGEVYRYSGKHKKIEAQRPRAHTSGYLRAVICGTDVYVHRLVAFCFIENPNGYAEVNHKDGNKQNNNADNLEWCTRSYNNRHAFQTGLRDYAELSAMGRVGGKLKRTFSPEQVREIRERKKQGEPSWKIGIDFGCKRTAIDNIFHRKTYAEVI